MDEYFKARKALQEQLDNLKAMIRYVDDPMVLEIILAYIKESEDALAEGPECLH